MSDKIRGFKASDLSAKRFRKSLIKSQNATESTFNEFHKAIDTGIRDTTQNNLSPRKLKDLANILTNYIENNHNIANLNTKEYQEFNNLKKLVHDTFEDYKWAYRTLKLNLSTKEQVVRDTAQQYLKWAEGIERRIIINKVNEIDNKIDENYESIEEERRTVMESIYELFQSNPEQLPSEIRRNIKDLRKEAKKLIENLMTVCSEEDIKESMDEIKDHIKTYVISETEYKEAPLIPKELSDKVNEIDMHYEAYGKLLEKFIQEKEGYHSLRSYL